MEPLRTLSLAALVILSLPLPLFASAAMARTPSARNRIYPWVWIHSLALAAAGLLLVATSLSAWIPVAIGGGSLVVCGMKMFARIPYHADLDPGASDAIS